MNMDNSNNDHCILDGNLHDRINDTILIADRITGSMQGGLIGDAMLLEDEIGDRIGNSLNLIGDDDIAIDPELLTLKPKALDGVDV